MSARFKAPCSPLQFALRAARSGLQPKHKQHRLVAHFSKLRRIYQCGLGNPAKPGQDCNILLAASLKGHGWSIEAGADIDVPKLLKAHVVIGSERSIDQACEKEATGRRECRT